MGKLTYRKCSPLLKGITFFRSSTNGTLMQKVETLWENWFRVAKDTLKII
jgi:hypothetical protein